MWECHLVLSNTSPTREIGGTSSISMLFADVLFLPGLDWALSRITFLAVEICVSSSEKVIYLNHIRAKLERKVFAVEKSGQKELLLLEGWVSIMAIKGTWCMIIFLNVEGEDVLEGTVCIEAQFAQFVYRSLIDQSKFDSMWNILLSLENDVKLITEVCLVLFPVTASWTGNEEYHSSFRVRCQVFS